MSGVRKLLELLSILLCPGFFFSEIFALDGAARIRIVFLST